MRTPPAISLRTPIGRYVDTEKEVVLLPNGERLTEQIIDEIVADVHAQLGRPSLTAPGRRSPVVSLRFAQETYDKLDRRAAAQGRPRSALIRDAVAAYLANTA
ncbi:CopG family transcriptional regulator [Propioniciclava tarda]|uniref:CopG family transcriptional regulator n=1 Tax=Propioniciclava tarda TaxID=433330 RepID=A0A4Q9KKH5_PROTD|nr:ribbon-helix-helix protein, CopG family [Propioniciclava tarda]TBT94986.1 CopG family transcriptional regulator [Propioniciclava tarda]SMO57365.1 Ribbon-helix-helix protein, copG family [Propioniciclava tarda]